MGFARIFALTALMKAAMVLLIVAVLLLVQE
jgi:hypothetical protein